MERARPTDTKNHNNPIQEGALVPEQEREQEQEGAGEPAEEA